MSNHFFIISETELESIYDSILLAGYSTYSSQVAVLFSKPEKNPPSLDELYEDYFLLELSSKDLDLIVMRIQSIPQMPGKEAELSKIVRNGLTQGNVSRSDED